LCTLVVVAQLQSVVAWDKEGHEAVGMTTMSALQPEPVAQVKRLMHGRDAVEVSAWAHKVNKKFPWTNDLHFQRQPSMTRCKGADLSICPGNKCLLQAMKHFYARLVAKPEKVPLVDIDWGKQKLTDADAVKYLINLVGDLHQPLHFGGALDLEGANITVEFRGKKVSLYDIWDKELTQTTIKEDPQFWWGGWTHVQHSGRTRVEYEQDSEKWKKAGILEFDRWANESADYLCDHIYKNPMSGQDLLPEMKAGNFKLREDLFQMWKREMLSKILVAGARTAIVLNSVLQHREGKEQLHAGTAVTGVEDGDEEPEKRVTVGRRADIAQHGVKPIHGVAALASNMAVFVVIQVLFLWLMRMWRGKDVTARADRAKQAGGPGGKSI
jgi:hypothetical protein